MVNFGQVVCMSDGIINKGGTRNGHDVNTHSLIRSTTVV